MSRLRELGSESEICSLVHISGVIYIKAKSGNLAESRLPSFVFPNFVLSVISMAFCLLPCFSLIWSPLFLPELQRLDEESR